MKQKIIGTGLSGMVGSRIVELLKDQYEFEDLSLEAKVDIRHKKKVEQKISQSKAEIVLHLAAKTDVDGCEKDKALGKKGDAWTINVGGTKNVVDACQHLDKKIIYISTDFVFDGESPPAGGYTEEDKANPINWYGQTKYEGEKIVQNSRNRWLILRIAYPYRAKFTQKLDFVRLILEKLRKNQQVLALIDHIFTPTFIDDVVFGLNTLIKRGSVGIFHLVGSQFLTPYQAINLIAEQFGLDKVLIKGVKMKNYYQNRALRPKNLALKNEKIKKLGIKMRTFEEGIKELRKQI